MSQNRTCLLAAPAALLALALHLGFIPNSHAAITVLDYWRMGENDPGASPGGVAVNPTVDSVGSRPLSFSASPFWESVSSSTAICDTGSSLCLYFFANGVFSTNVVLPSLTNNFGIELWVNPNSTNSTQCLVYTGDSAFNGWGIYQFGTTYQGLLGGNAYVGSATATAGVWTHLALVINNGTATFYVNGVSAGSAATGPNPSVETLNVGINAPGGLHDQFLGYMDEMRLFTFAPGQFSPSDLLMNAAGLPALASASVGSTTTSNAVLQASVRPGSGSATAWFVYGFDTNYGLSTPSANIDCPGTLSFTNLVSYLFTGSTYHYAVVVTNSAGSFTSQDFTFTLPGVTNITVTTTADGGPGSLRQAILNAAGGGTINISATGIITLTNPLPAIFKGLTINGPGAGNLTINGNNLWRLFFVDAGSGTVNINNLTLANGRAKGGDGGMGSSGGGGGLGAGGALFANSGSVVLSNLIFSGNSAAGGNGGSWTNNGGGTAGGGGGLGGNGGSDTYGCGGGGGFFGVGGSSTLNGGGGGGGGFAGKGGTGWSSSGGGGGALGDGQDATAGGAGGPGGGGSGGLANGETAPANGGPGLSFGGGGGGADGYDPGTGHYGGNGGAGGKFGGGGGAFGDLNGGSGGDFGGGGGAAGQYTSGIVDDGGNGGFGGGGGAEGHNGYPGRGGFGGGGGGGLSRVGNPGVLGGNGGEGDIAHSYGAGGGGGAALGGVIFVRAITGASVTIYNSSLDTGSLTPGAAGASPGTRVFAPGAGQIAGSSIFGFGGTNIVTVSAGTNTITGTIADTYGLGLAGLATSLAKNGNGTLVLSGNNSYSGYTLVNAGTLTVNGNNGSSSTYVASGATLAGAGTVGSLTLNPGGTIAPGMGTLTINGSVWSGAGNHNWQLYDATNTAGVGYGTLQINGSLDVSSASGFAINLWTLSSKSPPANGNPLNFPALAGDSWKLVHTTSGIVGFNATNFVINNAPYNGAGGFSSSLPQVSFSLGVAGNDLILTPVTQPFLSAQPPSGITSSSATLNAQVNPYNAASYVSFVWGYTTAYGATNVLSIGAGGAPVSVTNQLSNLLVNTVYHYQIIATNSLGTVTSGDQTFTTLTTAPVVVTLAASNINPAYATLNATVNPQRLSTTWYFQYGTTTGYGGTTATNSLSAYSTPQPVSGLISGLSSGTLYHYRIVATNSAGTSFGSDATFTSTTALAPSVQTQAASGATNNSVTLNASINPNGAATTTYFQYGLTTGYGSFTSTQAVPSIAVSFNGVNQSASLLAALAGLSAGNTPHSIEAWLKPSLLATNREWALLLDGQHVGAHHWLINADGTAQMGVYGGAQLNPVLASNVWVHLAACFDGTNYSVYTNGVMVGTVAASFNIENFTLTLAQPHLGESYYSGAIDELRIWNTGRIAAQIQANMNTPLVGNESGLIAYYRMDEGTGSTLNDASGYANTLQVNNTPAWTTGSPVAGLPTSAQTYPSQTFLNGLTPGTVYHYRAVAVNSVGTTFGNDLTFTTPPALSPSVTTRVATAVTSTNAVLYADINPNGGATTNYFQYGLTTNYGSFSSTVSLPATNLPILISLPITGLAPGSLYHFRAVAGNSAGTTAGLDRIFTTPGAPTIVTQLATGVFSSGASLNATVNPNGAPTALYFQYGLTAAYGSTSSTQSLSAGALNFDGVSQFASETLTGLNGGNSAHTIEAWLNPTLLPTSREWVVLLGAAGNGAHHWLLQTNGAAQIGVFNGNQVIPTLAPGAWTHLAASFDGTTLAVYTNGVLVGQTNATFNVLGGALALGQAIAGESYYGGGMDDLRIWNTARTAAEIQSNYNVTLTGSEPGLLAWLRMDEGSGSTLADSSGLGNSITNSTATWTYGVPLPTTITQNLGGLRPATTYHFRTVTASSLGTSMSGEQTFVTPAAAPYVVTQPATGITASNATLNATINPGGSGTVFYFQYGSTTNYGNLTPLKPVPDVGLNFNGVNQSAGAITPLTGLGAGNQAHTIEAWLKPTLAPSGREWVMLLDGTHPGAHHWLLTADGTAQIGSYSGAQVNPPLNSNVWTHLAASFDGTNLSVYTNGVLAGTVAASFSFANFALTLAQSYLGESFYAGGMDELRIWNTARTAAQIQSNYNVPLVGNETGLIAYYRMDEGAGSALTDASQHNNNLQTTNAPAWTTGAPLIAGESTVQDYAMSAAVGALAAGTLYHYQLVASNSVGVVFGSDMTFTTVAVPPSLATLAATSVTSSGASLNATVNPNGAATTVNFQYGPTTIYGGTSSSISLPATNGVFSTNIVISGLSPGTLYHFQAFATNSVGGANGGDLTLTTLAASPSVTTLAASNLTIASAQLNGLVNPNGAAATIYFRYGLDTNYGSFSTTNSVGAGTADLVSSLTITGLSNGGTYHFQAIAANSVGTNSGADQAFTLPSPLASPFALVGMTHLADGTFQFSFTNTPGASFTVFAATNIALPLSNWDALSNVVVESPPGQFHFSDPQAATNGQRFYRVRSP